MSSGQPAAAELDALQEAPIATDGFSLACLNTANANPNSINNAFTCIDKPQLPVCLSRRQIGSRQRPSGSTFSRLLDGESISLPANNKDVPMPNSTEKAGSTTMPSEVPKQQHRAVDKVLERRRQAIRLGRLAMCYNLHLADDEMLNQVLAEVSQRLLSQGQQPAWPTRVDPTVVNGVSSLAESTACEDA